MRIEGRVAVVTGGASGIGAALARRFARDGAAGVVVADFDGEGARAVAAEIGGLGVACDVATEAGVRELVERTRERHGRIDVFCSNAGVVRLGDEHAPDEEWRESFDVHVMAHVYAARAVVPEMVERGEGYLIHTASAAGLLAHVSSATYSVTKHAAVAFAEWLSIRHGASGVRVSVLCPQGVRTGMTRGRETGVASVDGMIEADEVAQCVVESMERESFLILPHPAVLGYVQGKAQDCERWLAGMRKLRERFGDGP